MTYDASVNCLYIWFDRSNPPTETLVHLSVIPQSTPEDISYQDYTIIPYPGVVRGWTYPPNPIAHQGFGIVQPYVYEACRTCLCVDSIVVTLVEGYQYGTISNSNTENASPPIILREINEDWINAFVDRSAEYEGLLFNANGAIPDATARVRVQFSTIDGSVEPWEASFFVNPRDSVVGQAIPSTVFAGDTVGFALQNKKEILGGVLQNFPDSARFTVRMLQGVDYGGLIAAGDTTVASELHGVLKGFHLVTNNTFADDSVMIGLLVTAGGIYPTDTGLQGKSMAKAGSSLLVPLSKTTATSLPVWLPKGLHATPNAILGGPSSSVHGAPGEGHVDSLKFVVPEQPNVWVVVKRRSNCVSLKILPDVLNPGDTAWVILSRLLPDGSSSSYPPEKLFHVSITEGDVAGTLWAEGEMGNDLNGYHQPFKFIARTALPVVSVSVSISAYEMVDQAAPKIISVTPKIQSHQLLHSIPNKTNSGAGGINLQPRLAMGGCDPSASFSVTEFSDCAENLNITVRPRQQDDLGQCNDGTTAGYCFHEYPSTDADGNKPFGINRGLILHACYDRSRKCVSLMASQLMAWIEYGICTRVLNGKTDINSAYDDELSDASQARKVVAEYKRQIAEINTIIDNFARAKNGGPPVSGPQREIHMSDFISTAALLGHEIDHINRIKGYLLQAANTSIPRFKKSLDCLPLTVVRGMQDEDEVIQALNGGELLERFNKEYETLRDKDLNDNEILAHIKQRDMLKSLVQSIQHRFEGK